MDKDKHHGEAQQGPPTRSGAAQAGATGQAKTPSADKAHGELRETANRFMANLPTEARESGTYTVKEEGDPHFAQKIDGLQDGTYRMTGSDWLFDVKGGKVSGVKKAMPPDYGGEDVVQIPN